MPDPDLKGRVCFITGPSSGIGEATALALGSCGARLVLAARSRERTQPLLAELHRREVPAQFVELDLADLCSVRSCAESFLATGSALHVLLNNAGVGGARGVTKDGFELAFGVNHLGHFLLTELMMPRLIESAAPGSPGRVVLVSSDFHRWARGIDWPAVEGATRHLTAMPEYATSKLCNILHAQALARRLAGTAVHSYALHPGVVASNFWRSFPRLLQPAIKAFMKSPEQGARNSVYCASSEEIAHQSGNYYVACRCATPSRAAQDRALADQLYERSREFTGLSR